MRESKVEDYLKKRVKELGGKCLKLRFLGYAGAPDRLILLRRRHPLIELKRPGKNAEAHQLRVHKLLRWAGFEVYVCDTFEKIDEVLNG